MSEQHDQRIDDEPIDNRKAELEAAYQQNIAQDKAPYEGVQIATYGELLWIFQQRHWSGEYYLQEGMQRANLSGADLGHANLSGADLREANLSGAYLGIANLSRAHLAKANLSEANLGQGNLSRADLGIANLSGAILREANLSRAILGFANLSEADLGEANLSEARLNGIILADRQQGGVSLYEARLEDANLSVVDWEQLTILGDEFSDSWWQWLRQSRFLGWAEDYDEHRSAARAYQRLSKTLRDQNLNDEADRYAYRAQICRRRMAFRKILAWPSRLPQYVLSHFLNLIAGYGYRPERTLFVYVLFILGFAFAYMHTGMIDQHAFTLHEALIFSLTSFHGRGFFPGGLTLDDPITTLAAVEAVVGLVVEVSFIATFTQRFFAR